MATTWRRILVAVVLSGCETSHHHESLRYPEHRKLEEHRLDVLEASAPRSEERLQALERQIGALQNAMRDLERALAEQKSAMAERAAPGVAARER